jgi:hypothetical protein
MTTRFKKSRADYPDGVLAIYDNGGRTIDRYRVIYAPFTVDGRNYFPTRDMSARPTHPQGYGISSDFGHKPRRLKGDRVIPFDALPEDCRLCIEDDLRSE